MSSGFHPVVLLSLQLDVDLGDKSISPFLKAVCGDARDATYAREADLRHVARCEYRVKVLTDGNYIYHCLVEKYSV